MKGQLMSLFRSGYRSTANYLVAGLALLLSPETFAQSTPLTGRCGEIYSIERSAIFPDGGSIEVDGTDRCGFRFAIRVDNSLDRLQQGGYAKVFLNDVEVMRRSPEEWKLLELLDRSAKRRLRGVSVGQFTSRLHVGSDQASMSTLGLVGVLQEICLRSTEHRYVSRCERYMR